MDTSQTALRSYLITLASIIDSKDAPEPNDFLPPVTPKDFTSYSTASLFSYLQKSLLQLLNFKSAYNLSDLFDIISEIEKFEKCTQEAEEKVRKRIFNSNELRIRLNDLKWTVEELESKEENYKKKSQKLEDKLTYLKIPKKYDENKIRLDMGKKLEDIQKAMETKNMRIDSITSDNEQLKQQLKAKERELKILKKEKRRIENVAHSIASSPLRIAIEELQPNPECSIFLGNILDKVPNSSRSQKTFDYKNVFGSPVAAFGKINSIPRRELFQNKSLFQFERVRK